MLKKLILILDIAFWVAQILHWICRGAEEVIGAVSNLLKRLDDEREEEK